MLGELKIPGGHIECPCGGTNEECFYCQGRGHYPKAEVGLVPLGGTEEDLGPGTDWPEDPLPPKVDTSPTKVAVRNQFQGIVAFVDKQKAQARVCYAPGKEGLLRYAGTEWERHPPRVGELVSGELQTSHDSMGLLSVVSRMSRVKSISVANIIKKFSGPLKVVNKADTPPFGFVQEVFVPASVLNLSSVTPGSQVVGIAVNSWDRRRKKLGWKAITIAPSNPG